MHLSSLLDMIESGYDDRYLLGSGDDRLRGGQLARTSRAAAAQLTDATALVYVGENHPHLPVALFAASCAGIPYVPVNYRLKDAQLHELVARQADAVVLADDLTVDRLGSFGAVSFDAWLAAVDRDTPPPDPRLDDDEVAVVLYTSGTTAAPKSALLRHRHLMAYLLGTVEFASATEDEAVLVAVPPYHVAGVANLLSNMFAGRRVVYQRSFDPEQWLDTVRRESITNAMVVPTMLARIVDVLGGQPADVPSLRTLSYGGSKVSERVLRDALTAFPNTGFVNAYGLTETASTIALLGPDDHRDALVSDDPGIRRRLRSVGRVVPTVEVEVRDPDGSPVGPDQPGMIYLRGEQIAGEYATGSLLDADGWFCTRDHGFVDVDGYLFIEGRADDTIIRGGENIAPSEIEEALLAQPAVVEACVVGVPDDEWGQRIEAAVVLREGVAIAGDELREAVRPQLGGSKTPDRVVVRTSMPHTDTGKLLRREVLSDLVASVEP